KANYLNVYVAKKPAVAGQPGEPIKGGQALLNAMMGILNQRAMTAVERPDKTWHCPEFEGKRIGLFLQKVLYTKNDGGEGYKFEIVVPFDPATGRTLRETVEGKPAAMIERMTASYKDRAEKPQAGAATTGAVGYADDPGAGGW